MAETGFSGLEELDSFVKDMLSLANEELPRESKTFLKKNANQLTTATRNKAKELGIMEKTGNYYKGFKSGKVYTYHGQLSCRAYNSSPHAHLLEYGHKIKNEKGGKYLTAKYGKDKNGKDIESDFVPGFHPFLRAYEDFMSKYYNNCESFVDDMINKHGL
ncbi:HK97 gp10 family phage protein [Clostridium sp. Mt-5]|uniref:HK97 gp10 family phage protein n=1 Tax=Clostridium moutaii TaxID=3240932 RepID=A0ABV4BSY3_9CLOT